MTPTNCRKCNQPLDIGAEFCGNCGSAIDPKRHPAPAHPATAVALQPAGEADFNGHATAALVLGIAALPASLLFYLGIPASIAAFTLGFLGRHSQKKGRAIAGIILAILALIATVAIFLFYLKTDVKKAPGDPGTF